MNCFTSCHCNDTDAFAKDAYHILFGEYPEPCLTLGEFEKYILAAERSDTKYAYGIHNDEFWDLLKGVRLA